MLSLLLLLLLLLLILFLLLQVVVVLIFLLLLQVSQSQSREMSQSLVVTSQGGLPLHRSSSFHQVTFGFCPNFDSCDNMNIQNIWHNICDNINIQNICQNQTSEDESGDDYSETAGDSSAHEGGSLRAHRLKSLSIFTFIVIVVTSSTETTSTWTTMSWSFRLGQTGFCRYHHLNITIFSLWEFEIFSQLNTMLSKLCKPI